MTHVGLTEIYFFMQEVLLSHESNLGYSRTSDLAKSHGAFPLFHAIPSESTCLTVVLLGGNWLVVS